MPNDPSKRKHESEKMKETYAGSLTCFCPINTCIVNNDMQYKISDRRYEVCEPCEVTDRFTKMDLIKHLCAMAYTKGCASHLVNTEYVVSDIKVHCNPARSNYFFYRIFYILY